MRSLGVVARNYWLRISMLVYLNHLNYLLNKVFLIG